MLTNTLGHSYTHIHTDIQSYTLTHTRYTCSKQLACTIPSKRYDYFTILKNTNTVHTVPLTKRHHNNISQGLWSDYLQLTQTNKFQDPPPTPLKNFGTPHFLLHPPPPPPSNLNSDWSLIRPHFHRRHKEVNFRIIPLNVLTETAYVQIVHIL